MWSLPCLLVFDLDGTLIDSRVDLVNSVNATLVEFGRAPLAAEVIAAYIGDGAYTLVERAFQHEGQAGTTKISDELIARAHLWFLDFYREHKLDFTYVYAGVHEALTAIRRRHPRLPMAVLTNKPVVPSRQICQHFALDRFFFAIYGGNSFATKKPHPQGLRALIEEASGHSGGGLTASQTVMIGDSHVDVETARAAGTRVVGCSFGLAPESLAKAGPDVTVDDPTEWPAVLGL